MCFVFESIKILLRSTEWTSYFHLKLKKRKTLIFILLSYLFNVVILSGSSGNSFCLFYIKISLLEAAMKASRCHQSPRIIMGVGNTFGKTRQLFRSEHWCVIFPPWSDTSGSACMFVDDWLEWNIWFVGRSLPLNSQIRGKKKHLHKFGPWLANTVSICWKVISLCEPAVRFALGRLNRVYFRSQTVRCKITFIFLDVRELVFFRLKISTQRTSTTSCSVQTEHSLYLSTALRTGNTKLNWKLEFEPEGAKKQSNQCNKNIQWQLFWLVKIFKKYI